MPYKIASISIFIFLLSLPISGRIINWATDADLNYAIGDIIIFNSANYVASAIGSQSPSENPSNFVNIEEELTEVSQNLPPDPPSWTAEELAAVQTQAAQLAAPDSNASDSTGLVSLSVRGRVGTGDNIRIMGFVLAGTGSGKILMRGLGPVLADWGLSSSSLLPNPKIRLFKYRSASNIQTGGSDEESSGKNFDYTDNTSSQLISINSARASVLPLVNLNDNQAISLPSLSSGFYTMWMEDENDLTGIGNAAVDLYDSPSHSFTHASSRGLVYVDEAMFGSFKISGTGTRKIYIRGRGPTLSKYNVDNVMSDPEIVLFKYINDPSDDLETPPVEPTEIASNDDYESNASTSDTIKAYSTSLHGWPEIDAKEPALLIDLEPGYYSAHLKSKSNLDDGKNGWIGIDDVTD